MLASLAIRDIVLIERLDLAFGDGLTVLTGETGAGKSIVLDALGLALGGRADKGLVRSGVAQGAVSAGFELPPEHPAWALLAEQAIAGEGELVLRRTLTADGRSRAFVNDEPVSIQLLRRLGEALVEVHGQHDQRGLLDPAHHRLHLDAFAGIDTELVELARAHAAWGEAAARLERLQAELNAARREEEWLRHREQELADLAARPGEEEELALERTRLGHREKLVAAVEEALAMVAGSGGARERAAQAERRLQRVQSLDEAMLAPPAEALARALIELDEAEAALGAAARDLEPDPNALERAEARLFGLREAARKHRVAVDDLPGLLEETRTLLERIDRGGDAVVAAERECDAALQCFQQQARVVSAARAEAAEQLAQAVMAELPPLKLERARLRVRLEPLPEAEWGKFGAERVAFEVSTNPGQPFGPLAKIASGGELSRLMLALKVVLARLDATPTLIFDEVDTGIGGATADAVGERLARLGEERQVLVVTHAPQVAARAAQHLVVAKAVRESTTFVQVQALAPVERRSEIARMLAGAEVTEAARAAAASLLERAGHAAGGRTGRNRARPAGRVSPGRAAVDRR